MKITLSAESARSDDSITLEELEDFTQKAAVIGVSRYRRPVIEIREGPRGGQRRGTIKRITVTATL